VLDQPPLFQIVLGVKYGFSGAAEILRYARSLLPAKARMFAHPTDIATLARCCRQYQKAGLSKRTTLGAETILPASFSHKAGLRPPMGMSTMVAQNHANKLAASGP
jgi:hypothetical protein